MTSAALHHQLLLHSSQPVNTGEERVTNNCILLRWNLCPLTPTEETWHHILEIPENKAINHTKDWVEQLTTRQRYRVKNEEGWTPWPGDTVHSSPLQHLWVWVASRLTTGESSSVSSVILYLFILDSSAEKETSPHPHSHSHLGSILNEQLTKSCPSFMFLENGRKPK